MKGTTILLCAFALAFGDENVQLNAQGCPVDPEVFLTIPDSTYCNVFYNCLAGLPVEQLCPGALVFNPAEGVCDWTNNVDCTGKGIKELESAETEEVVNPGGNNDPSQAVAICAADGSDGVLVAHEYCNQFYKCDQGEPIPIDCYDGLLYNSELGVCDWAYQVNCGNRIVPTKAQIKRAAYQK